MRFARLQCDGAGAPLGIEELAASGQLDFLQLDYPRARWAKVDGAAEAAIPECAIGFCDALRAVVKPLYLDPQLHLFASAGWADAYGAVERAAHLLVEGGCGDLPVAAVRGSNVEPILEMLEDEGVDLSHAETGAPWRELKAPVLAADLQLGGGPLALALAESARVIVAGAFDPTAPLVAAAVHRHGWKWRDCNLLASAIAGARAATWIDWQAYAGEEPAAQAWRPQVVELDSSGRLLLETLHDDAAAAARLQAWLRMGDGKAAEALHPDIREERGGLECQRLNPSQLEITGAQGVAGDDCWELEVLYQTGFVVETMVEFAAESDPRWRQHLATMARASLPANRDLDEHLTIEELRGSSGGGWLHLGFQSKSRRTAQQFADQTMKLVAAHRPHVRLSVRPEVHVHCNCWPVRVPRDAVDIAVETRVAREWL